MKVQTCLLIFSSCLFSLRNSRLVPQQVQMKLVCWSTSTNRINQLCRNFKQINNQWTKWMNTPSCPHLSRAIASIPRYLSSRLIAETTTTKRNYKSWTANCSRRWTTERNRWLAFTSGSTKPKRTTSSKISTPRHPRQKLHPRWQNTATVWSIVKFSRPPSTSGLRWATSDASKFPQCTKSWWKQSPRGQTQTARANAFFARWENNSKTSGFMLL